MGRQRLGDYGRLIARTMHIDSKAAACSVLCCFIAPLSHLQDELLSEQCMLQAGSYA